MGFSQQEAEERVSYTEDVLATHFGPGSDPTRDIAIPEHKLSILISDMLQEKWDSLRSQITIHQMNNEPVPVELHIQFNRIRKLAWQANRARVARREREGKKIKDTDRETVELERKLKSDVDAELRIFVELHNCKEPSQEKEIRKKLRELRCRNAPSKAGTGVAGKSSKKEAALEDTDEQAMPELKKAVDNFNKIARQVDARLDAHTLNPPGSAYRLCNVHDRYVEGPCTICWDNTGAKMEKASQLLKESAGRSLVKAVARNKHKQAEEEKRAAQRLRDVLERVDKLEEEEEALRLAAEKLKLGSGAEEKDS
ncbi:hypothetical protein V8F33_009844 [Rhypophila sp. PSN 637]